MTAADFHPAVTRPIQRFCFLHRRQYPAHSRLVAIEALPTAAGFSHMTRIFPLKPFQRPAASHGNPQAAGIRQQYPARRSLSCRQTIRPTLPVSAFRHPPLRVVRMTGPSLRYGDGNVSGRKTAVFRHSGPAVAQDAYIPGSGVDHRFNS